MANENIIIGLILGLIAYICLDIGKGIQKYAIEGFKEENSLKKKNSGIWVVGTILTSFYMFIQWAALFFAPINIVAPLEGVGLIVLLLFSYYILKEQITPIEISGVFFIIVGTVLVTLFNINVGSLSMSDFNLPFFLCFSIIILVIEAILIFISKLNDYKLVGIIIALTAGTTNALQTVSKRITTIPEMTLYFTLATFIFALLTLLITQYAFTKAKANQVVPCFTSTSIILASLMSILALNGSISWIQVIGIILIVIGIILISAFQKESENLTK